MLTIHGRKTSSNVQIVMWLVGELNLTHQRLDIGGNFGGTNTPEFLAKNPMGLVPVIEDNGFTVFETQTIQRYLAEKHSAETLWPPDTAARAAADQWMEWAKTSVFPPLTLKVFWQQIRTSAAARDHRLIAEGAAELRARMAIADTRLAQHDWLAGDKMTLADITFGSMLYRYFTLDFERGDYTHLARYYERLCGRAAYREHVMVPYDSLRVADA